jgi:hypothetical protein
MIVSGCHCKGLIRSDVPAICLVLNVPREDSMLAGFA